MQQPVGDPENATEQPEVAPKLSGWKSKMPAYNFTEVNFCALSSQSNVYGLTCISMPGGVNKILVASHRGKVVSMEYHKVSGNMRPVSREIQFTYIPGDAEIVSIDSFNKSHHGNGVVVGITFIKYMENKRSHFLNIYSDWEPGSEFNIDSIAQSCQSLVLNFVPFQLYHTILVSGGENKDMVWLLSGSDLKIHLFREDKNQHLFSEQSVLESFPELDNFPSPVHWMDIQYFDDHQRRLTAVGCQNGYVRLSYIDVEKNEVISSWETLHDGPVTSVKIFSIATAVDCPVHLFPFGGSDDASSDYGSDGNLVELPHYQLLVANAIEPSVIYRDVLRQGLCDVQVLIDSDTHDCVLCSCIADVDFDGQNEIVLGTYGQDLLIYKFFPHDTHVDVNNEQLLFAIETSDSPEDKDQTNDEGTEVAEYFPQATVEDVAPELCRETSKKVHGSYYMVHQKTYAFPLLAIMYADVTNDSLSEIIIVSQSGLHIMQYALRDVAKIVKGRLKHLVERLPSEDAFHALLLESL